MFFKGHQKVTFKYTIHNNHFTMSYIQIRRDITNDSWGRWKPNKNAATGTTSGIHKNEIKQVCSIKMTTNFSNKCYVIAPISLSEQPIQACNIRRSCNLHSYCMTLYKYITCTCCGNVCTLTMPFVYKEHVLLLNMIIIYF